jgi:nitroimidazol reductase NimA-like FMN-containing flavoprotein (pyridoxamine 5'-phosphate oxidase superfamily)
LGSLESGVGWRARATGSLSVPINFAFDGTYLYGFTTLGQKIAWMRANPLVCLEVDEIISENQWLSIIVFGRYEELPDKPEYERARVRVHAFLQKAAHMVVAGRPFSGAPRPTSLVDTNCLSFTGQEDHWTRATPDEPALATAQGKLKRMRRMIVGGLPRELEI